MEWSKSIKRRPLSEAVLRDIYASDQDMYPADLPFSRLQGWVETAPGLSIEFVCVDGEDEVSVGVVVAMPVRLDRWHALLAGDIKETNVEASSDFASVSQQSESQRSVGVHIFHIERYTSELKGLVVRGFGKYAVDAAVEAARAEGYTVVGASALTATEDGQRTFERLGFRPTGYEEVWADGQARMMRRDQSDRS